MSSRAHSISRVYDGLRASDDILAKALGLSGQARVAKLEVRLRDYIRTQWNRLAEEAIDEAAGRLERGRGDSISQRDIDTSLSVIDKTMGRWSDFIKSRYTEDIEAVYKIGRTDGLVKGLGLTSASMAYPLPEVAKADVIPITNINPRFNLIDYQAIAAFKKHQTFWLDGFYDKNVSNAIAGAAKEQLLEGMGRKDAGQWMRDVADRYVHSTKTPDGYQGSTDSYFEGLVANATTSARVSGHLASFDEVGVTIYVVVNPMDHRTCEVCQYMDGKEFRVQDGMSLLNRVIKAPTPDAVKKIQPWLTPGKAKALAGGMGRAGVDRTGDLAKAGFLLPSFHFLCRCDLDIVRESIRVPTVGEPEKKPERKPRQAKPRQPKPRQDGVASFELPALPAREEILKGILELQKSWTLAPQRGEYTRFRRVTEEFIEKGWGVGQYDGRTLSELKLMKVLDEKEMGPTSFGSHDYFGVIRIRADQAATTADSLARLADAQSPSLSTSGFHTIVHEIVHGANRVGPSGYAEGGAVITEVCTELTSRRIVMDMATKTALGVRDVAFTSSYQGKIGKVERVLKEHTGWKMNKIHFEMERSAMLFNTAKAKHAALPEEVIDNFVNHLPGVKELSESAQAAIKKDLLSLEAEWLKKK